MLFYTYPPIDYPYVLRNVKQKYRRCIHEIVDIGVYELLKEPHSYSDKTLKKFDDCITMGWKTVPDYPDIFKEHGLDSMGIDNVKISKELMQKYYEPTNKTHLPVIQGYYNDPSSFDDYSEWFLSKYPEPKKIGLGTVCKNSNRQVLFKTLKIVRKNFPNSHIHAFGLTIKYVDKFKYIIDSFDSTAWTFPRGQGHSCKNKQERIEYFEEYLEIFHRKNRILNQELTAYF